MTTRHDAAQAVAALPAQAAAWDAYLTAHSGLPGPRANLELLHAVAAAATPQYLWHAAASSDEYLAMCGAAGLGRLVVEGDAEAAVRLRELAADDRWRVREGVAMALQTLGDADPATLRTLTTAWADDAPLVQRAAVAGLCEPRLLQTDDAVRHTLAVLDQVTTALVALPGPRRAEPGTRALRKALGYAWSVAVAAGPEVGFPRLERWATHPDADVRWVVRENLRKARLGRADAARTAHLADTFSGRAAAR